MTERITAKKSLGQYFLNNERVPQAMADAVDITADDTVFEIGPGTGVLTKELLARGAHVIALEADPRAINSLTSTFGEEIATQRLSLHHGDARSFDLSALGLKEHEYKVVANIPYYLSGKLFRTFLSSDCQPVLLVFLIQREVAERIAKDTKESLLSLSVKIYGDPEYVKTVKRGNFSPQPQVDSAIVVVRNISHARLAGIDDSFFFEVLHCGFGSKRKQLLGNLTQMFPRKTLEHTFSTLNIPLSTRAEDLSLSIWLDLVRALEVHR